MNGLLNIRAANWQKQPMSSIGRMKRIPKWLKLVSAVGVTGALFLLAALFFVFRPVTISGRIISADTKTPLSDVLVAVESGTNYEDSTLGSYVRSDKDGRFTATAKGMWVSIRAWKYGYAMNGINYGYAFPHIGRESVIELRKMTETNWLPAHDTLFKFKPGDGFSFALGKVVDGNSPDADVVISQNKTSATIVFIEARGEGGIILQPINDEVNFPNSPEAPLTGYEKSALYDRSDSQSEGKFYFVRTQDGKHYAKFWLNIDLVMQPSGDAYLDFDMNTRMQWVYQPDGTRNLEVAPSKEMAFPFYKFGLKSESLEP